MFGINQGGWAAYGSAFFKAWEHRYIHKKSPDLKTRTFGLSPFAKLSLEELPAGIALLRLT